MTTIYLVTSGSYSDYSVDAVFDSREKAETFVAYQRAHDTLSDIEERDLNAPYDRLTQGYQVYTVSFDDARTGDARISPTSVGKDAEWEHGSTRGIDNQIPYFFCTVWAKDEEGAAKIANERRVRYLLRLDQEAREHREES